MLLLAAAETEKTYLYIKSSSDSRSLCSNCVRSSALLCKYGEQRDGAAPCVRERVRARCTQVTCGAVRCRAHSKINSCLQYSKYRKIQGTHSFLLLNVCCTLLLKEKSVRGHRNVSFNYKVSLEDTHLMTNSGLLNPHI